MIYLSTFAISEKRMKNPNIYPYNVFRTKDIYPFVFAPITIIYGNNGSGKSTLLNIIAQKINARGCETYAYGQGYIDKFVCECRFDVGEDESGTALHIPKDSLYMKSEDILFEIVFFFELIWNVHLLIFLVQSWNNSGFHQSHGL